MAVTRRSSKEGPNRTRAEQVKFYATAADKALLVALSEHIGVSMGDVCIMLIRERARAEGLSVSPTQSKR